MISQAVPFYGAVQQLFVFTLLELFFADSEGCILGKNKGAERVSPKMINQPLKC